MRDRWPPGGSWFWGPDAWADYALWAIGALLIWWLV